MNYLAHLFLSGNAPGEVIGNLAVDFIKGGHPRYAYPAIRAGVERHHAIDLFTDTHPAFRESCRRIRPPHQRYAGVIVDLFYDHYLARDWSRYGGASLAAFSQWGYDLLQRHERWLPERLQRALPHMIREDWMGLYAQPRGIERALRGLSRRARRPIALEQALDDLHDFDDAFAKDFSDFLPELMAHIERLHGGPLAGRLAADELTRATLTGEAPIIDRG